MLGIVVPLEVVVSGKGLVAMLTLELFLFGVFWHVSSQVFVPDEAGAADFAFELSVFVGELVVAVADISKRTASFLVGYIRQV